MSGTAQPCHGIVSSRLGAAALLLAAIGCGGDRRSAATAPTTSGAPVVASASPASEASPLRPASLRIIGELRSPLWLDLYVSPKVRGITEPAKDAERLLRAYESAGKGRIKLSVHHVDEDTPSDAAREAGMVEVGERLPEQLGFFGLTLRYEDQRAVMPSLPLDASNGFEFWITNKLREVRDLAEHRQHRFGVVTGKSEIKLSDPVLAPRGAAQPNIEGILKQAFPFYTLVPVDLAAGKAAVDPSLAGLLVTQPGQDYTLEELQRIDQFLLLGGKSLAVFASAVNVPAGSPELQGSLSAHGLEKLLHGYGVELEANVLWDHGSSFALEILMPGGNHARVRYPAIPLVYSDPKAPSQGPLDASSAPFFGLDRLAFPHTSSLRLDPSQQPTGTAIRGIARTTSNTSATSASPMNLRPADRYPRDNLGTYLIAATVQGRLRSAFPVESKGVLGPVAPTPSRLLVVASSTYLTNPFVYADSESKPSPLLAQLQPAYTKHLTATIVSLKNTLDWMLADDDFVELSATIVPPSR